MTQVIPEKRNPLPIADPDPDLPAESVRIRIDDDGVLQWLDNLHPVYDRDDSTKGTTNPKSHNHHHQHHLNPSPNPNSQRFSGNLKATTKAQIIGLPGAGAAVQHSGHIGHSARRHPPPIFPPKKPRVATSSLTDPVSPKVSCFGKVQSERRRSDSPAEGCWLSLLAWFGRREPASASQTVTPALQRNFPARLSKDAPPAEPPGIGGMKRFVSGRRPASWGGDVELDLDGAEDGHVPWSGPLIRRTEKRYLARLNEPGAASLSSAASARRIRQLLLLGRFVPFSVTCAARLRTDRTPSDILLRPELPLRHLPDLTDPRWQILLGIFFFIFEFFSSFNSPP